MSLTKLYHKMALGLFGPSSKFILYPYTFIISFELKKSWWSKINICYADMFNKSSYMMFVWFSSNTMGARSGAGTANPSEAPEFTSSFSEVRVILFLANWHRCHYCCQKCKYLFFR
jgi:hypothetical protein